MSVDAAKLTAREREVLELLANGLHTSEIGAQLGVSENTVKTHARHLQVKLGASTRAHAVTLGFCFKLLCGRQRSCGERRAERLP